MGRCMEVNNQLWFQKTTKKILFDHYAIAVDNKTAIAIENWVLDSENPIDCWYMLNAIINNLNDKSIGINFILGPLFKYYKSNQNIKLTGRERFYINEILLLVESKKLDKKFIEDIFLEMMNISRTITHDSIAELLQLSQIVNDDGYLTYQYAYDMLVLIDLHITNTSNYIFGRKFISNLAYQEKYKLTNSSEIDIIIEEVIKNNIDKALSVKDNPKMLPWLTGQVMKILKGKGNGNEITNKIKQIISNMENE